VAWLLCILASMVLITYRELVGIYCLLPQALAEVVDELHSSAGLVVPVVVAVDDNTLA
jgi:hypothetical protein